MREIKFRAQDFTHKWNYGFVAKENESAVIFPVANDGTVFLGIQIEVLPDTIGQFTGLRDKNGKEIYEGDILSIEGEPFGFIKWNPDGFFYIHTSTVFEYQDCIEVGKMIKKYPAEVVGNIHDNPEQLNKE